MQSCKLPTLRGFCLFLQLHTPFVTNTHRGRPIVSSTSSITEKNHYVDHHQKPLDLCAFYKSVSEGQKGPSVGARQFRIACIATCLLNHLHLHTCTLKYGFCHQPLTQALRNYVEYTLLHFEYTSGKTVDFLLFYIVYLPQARQQP